MKLSEVSEWRGWIWIAVFLFLTATGTAFGIYEKAEQYADLRVGELREQLQAELGEMKQDLRTIRGDIKELLRRR